MTDQADAQPSPAGADTGSNVAAGVSAGLAAAPASFNALFSGTGLKDPRHLAEAIIVKMLSIYEQLANANLLLSVPQVRVCKCARGPARAQ